MRKIVAGVLPAFTKHPKVGDDCKLPADLVTNLVTEFKSTLEYLQFFGSCPVYLVPKEGPEIKWEFKAKFLSRQTIFPTITSAIFLLLIWIKYIIEMGLGRSFLGNHIQTSKVDFLNFTMQTSELMKSEDCHGCLTLGRLWKIFTFFIPINIISTLIASWVDAPALAQLLNEWIKLEAGFRAACCWTARVKTIPQTLQEFDTGSVSLLSLSEWRKGHYLYLVIIPLMVAVPTCIHSNVHYNDIPEAIVAVSMALHFIAYPWVNAMTAAMMYKCMAMAFQQTCRSMESALKCGQWDLALVSSWRHFIDKLRGQCKLLGKAYTRTEFINVAWVFAVLTIFSFTLANGNRETRNATQVMATLSIYGLGYLLTLLIKVCAAEKIAHEESAIASLIASVESRDSLVLQELKFIHDMIATRPSEISVGNYVTLNRKLVLSLIGQISTYLIVLTQFSQNR